MLRLRNLEENEVLITIAVNIKVPQDKLTDELTALMNKTAEGFEKMVPVIEGWNQVTIDNKWRLAAKD